MSIIADAVALAMRMLLDANPHADRMPVVFERTTGLTIKQLFTQHVDLITRSEHDLPTRVANLECFIMFGVVSQGPYDPLSDYRGWALREGFVLKSVSLLTQTSASEPPQDIFAMRGPRMREATIKLWSQLLDTTSEVPIWISELRDTELTKCIEAGMVSDPIPLVPSLINHLRYS